ncbi:DNA-binding transcription factor, zf-fungal binuclear cluster type [Schizosaccharomyces pombe]|uniref:Uncharacterized transcriptional regulatory protein C11D3.07c n=1 Tax=Schizosaccharomyces pombe (strain 972 / ATCC 24843) TaxID=284812 RepID=YAO7_SCHPO|nr:putative transcription factor [Schizosaccharomyces pombe]Q10086.3 RecName: Full=Uncharacterized transcriptional regulatory protein C11D3.07c [Schizosaccharomyces pombe 972h-]CAA92308.3 transcription factor (predicted) [Schizosaccharomyces pombe]|eukprot:NP_592804.2 putative transcription factor [Schizosaccharomyces pombe]
MSQNKACDLCRLKKIKCSRGQPRCQTCTLFQADCHYSNRARRKRLVQRSKETFGGITLPVFDYAAGINGNEPEPSDHSIPNQENFALTTNGTISKNIEKPEDGEESVQRRLKLLEEKIDLLLDIATETSEFKRENKAIELPSLVTQIKDAESIVIKHRQGSPVDNTPTRILNVESLFPPQLPDWEKAFHDIPKKEVAHELVTSYFQHVNWWWPTFVYNDFMYEFERLYAFGFHSNNAWLISFYSILALSSIRKRLGNSKTLAESLFSTAWVFVQKSDFFLTPSIDKVQALIVMTQYAAYLSSSSLCRTLCGQACLMAQQLNLHRKQSTDVEPEKAESWKRIFWMCYILDKNISLIFGTPSVFNDKDIDCNLPDSKYELLFGVQSGGDLIFVPTVSLTIIQSEIRNRLYSVKSPTQMAAREKIIIPIHQKLKAWEENLPSEIKMYHEMLLNNTFSPTISLSDRFEFLTFAGMEVYFSYLNTLIILHRPSSSTENRRICINAAREAVQLLKNRLNIDLRVNVKADPLWIFLYCPFTPFLIIFNNLVHETDTETDSETLLNDLDLLHVIYDFFMEMEPVSDVALELVKIADKLLRVAKEVCSAKNNDVTDSTFKDIVEGFELNDLNSWDFDRVTNVMRNL